MGEALLRKSAAALKLKPGKTPQQRLRNGEDRARRIAALLKERPDLGPVLLPKLDQQESQNELKRLLIRSAQMTAKMTPEQRASRPRRRQSEA